MNPVSFLHVSSCLLTPSFWDSVPGVIRTIAGNGTDGSGGDRGPAISPQLNVSDGLIPELVTALEKAEEAAAKAGLITNR